jgi:hypothetical protein
MKSDAYSFAGSCNAVRSLVQKDKEQEKHPAIPGQILADWEYPVS